MSRLGLTTTSSRKHRATAKDVYYIRTPIVFTEDPMVKEEEAGTWSMHQNLVKTQLKSLRDLSDMMMQQSLIILQKVSSFRSNFISYDIIKASGLPEAFLCVQAWSNAGNRQSNDSRQ